MHVEFQVHRISFPMCIVHLDQVSFVIRLAATVFVDSFIDVDLYILKRISYCITYIELNV